jgi:putative endonuclease
MRASRSWQAGFHAVSFSVCILELHDHRLYVGHSNDAVRLESEHQRGKGCRTTSIFGSGKLLYVEECQSREAAMKRERQLKGWSRAKKLALANGNLANLHELSRRRSP